jgi:hypothetical protein
VALVTEIKYVGPISPVFIAGVGEIIAGATFSVSNELAESLLSQPTNYRSVVSDKDKK